MGSIYPPPHEKLVHHIVFGDSKTIELYCDLTPYQVEIIERLRDGDDLRLGITVFVQEDVKPDSLIVKRPYQIGATGRMAKSDWIEKYLPKLGYKRVKLIEVPMLPESIPEEFKDAPTYLEGAWKHYLTGDYDEVMVDCRRVMEVIATAVKRLGCEKYETDEKTGRGSLSQTGRSSSRVTRR